MGLISGLLTLPFAPVRGVVWVAEQIQQEAERQWSSPGVIRQELLALQQQREQGLIEPAEADAREEELLGRLVGSGEPQALDVVARTGDDG